MNNSENSLQPCPICGRIAYLEEHHITPICYGGPKNGPLVSICESCHANIHKTAESINAKTVKNKNWFENENLLKKAAPYIQAILEAKRRKDDGEIDIYAKKRKMIVVELSEYEWKRIRKVSKDKGFSNVNTFIETFLRNLTKF